MRYPFLRFPGGKMKAVTLSYDDGVKADVRLAEILNKYGIKCTFNLNSDYMWREDKTNPDVFKEKILPFGHEIAVHGARHIAPGIGSPALVIADVQKCRLALEDTFGTMIRGMAYPDSGIRLMHNGNSYENIRQYLKDLGIVYARTLGGDNDSFMIPSDFYDWMPTAHHNNPNLMDYVKRFTDVDDGASYSAARYPRLFYLWGHSYEFDNNDNWNVIEEFCEKIGNRPDTYYATNMEIYEYVTAFQSLIFSADGSKIYNPTLKTIWLDIDKKAYKIESDQTITVD